MKRLLIANRGEIALRILRTAQAMGISTVAVYSDADAGALHVAQATGAHALGGHAPADSYLRIDKLLAAAQASGADAVHPGYGFLSENADFAQAVVDAGLVWVGPPPAAIRQLGSKSAAKALAQSRGIPCLPGYQGPDQSDERLMQEARRLGLPVMVKAAAGGGGRGMRLVTDLAQLPAAVQGARSEALSAFGSGELLLERALLAPRHVEVQVFADAQGHCIHLGERDCSVQRRHQKIIEETPSPAVDAALRARMGECAVALAQAAGYVGAGTVEFLLDGSGLSDAGSPQGAKAPPGGSAVDAAASAGAFYLMEMNTRLQVEHPVTEKVTGLDLVEWQIRVARGEALPLSQSQVPFHGHAIEVRLCAEDEDFTPHTGTVRHFQAPAGVRFDHALAPGQQVSPYYDSMLGKLVAHAASRAEAIDQLAGALDRLQLLGLPTNRAFLAACLRHKTFRAGQALIPFLAEQGPLIREALLKQEREVAVPCGLAAILANDSGQAVSPGGLSCPFPRPVRLRHRGQVHELRWTAATPVPAGVARTLVQPRRWHVQAGAVDLFLEDASFDPPAGSGAAGGGDELRAPFNGKVVAVAVAPGARVAPGDVLVVVESMKLEHSLAASRAGAVALVAVAPGQQVTPGQVLVRLEP
ncbi:MAG: biotin/lipoyl-binding protein [Ramlibacter sp.]|nr:biotin/lipoyl-binding protein [Ramlibacter sp.]